MTKEEKLLYAIGEIDDDLILEAGESAPNVVHFPAKTAWKKIAMTAACFLFVAGVWFSVGDMFRMGSSKPAAPEAPQAAPSAPAESVTESSELMEDHSIPEEAPPETSETPAAPPINDPMEEMKQQPQSGTETEAPNPTIGGIGGADRVDAEYLQYYLPVQPLNINGEMDSLFVEREMTVDASNVPFILDDEKLEPTDHYFTHGNIGENTVNISDQYLISNSCSEPVTVDLQYCYGESLDHQNNVTMTVDGSSEGQTRTAGYGLSTSAVWPEVENHESFRDFTGRVYNLPKIPYSEIAQVYRFHSVEAGNVDKNRSAIHLEFNVPKGIPVYFENADGVRTNEGEFHHYEVSGGLRSGEWTVLICGDVETEFDVSFTERRNGETVYLKADYELDEDSVNARSCLLKKLRDDLAENPLKNKMLTDEEALNAVFEIMYRPEKLYSQKERTATQFISELFIDALGGCRYMKLNQTVTIPANGSVTVEVQLEKPLNEFYEDSALGLELLNDGMMPTTVTFLPPKLGATVKSNLPENGALAPGVNCYFITMKQELCDGVPLKE